MADLFLAKTVTDSFERVVVLKKILPKYASSPRFVQLFLDEAKLAASLSHKNIVQVFDVSPAGADSFFAMEFVHGNDVRTLLHRAWKRNEKMPVRFAIQIAAQVAHALHFAHEKRRPDGSLLDIVHRDVSPSNVVVSYDGAVKLLDFGVAKAATSTIKTRTGTLKGKIAYMSPEQAKGMSIDRRSDIFSLGIVLWEMVTTTRLYRGENDLATLQLIINQPPRRPSELNPDCPPELERIILRALAQDPKVRFQTAHELAVELEDLVRRLQIVQSPTELSLYVSVLFELEINSWQKAQAAGVELSEHLTSAGGELTTPISESEFIEPVEEIDDELEEELDEEPETLRPVAGIIEAAPAVPLAVPSAGETSGPIRGSTPILRAEASGPVRSSTPVGREGGTPPPTPRAATSQPIRPQAARLDGTPLPSVMVGRVDPTLTTRSDGAGTRTPPPTPSAGVPVAWPAAARPVSLDAPFTPAQAARLKKQFVWAGGGLIGLILLVAIVRGAAGSSEATAPEPEAAGSPVADPPADPPADPVVEPPAPPPVDPVHAATPPLDAGIELAVDAAPVAPVVIDAAVTPPVVVKPTVKRPHGVRKPPVIKKPDPKRPRTFDPNAPLPRRR